MPLTPERWGLDPGQGGDKVVGWTRYFKSGIDLDPLSGQADAHTQSQSQIEETLDRIRERQAEREENQARLVYAQATRTSQRPDEPWDAEFCQSLAWEVRAKRPKAASYYTAAAVGLYPVRSLTSPGFGRDSRGNYAWVATLFPRISGGTVRTADWFQSAGLLFGKIYYGLAQTYIALADAYDKLQPIERYILTVMTRHRDQETGAGECWKT